MNKNNEKNKDCCTLLRVRSPLEYHESHEPRFLARNLGMSTLFPISRMQFEDAVVDWALTFSGVPLRSN